MTPLEGIRVVDVSTVVMAPYATQLLADLGADVTKIEPPDRDIIRNVSNGAMFAHLNRGKHGIMLDLKTPDGQREFHQHVTTADVLVHNMRPNAAKRLGLRRRDLEGVNPRLIVACAIGYGSAGPYAARPAYDDLIQAASGMADLVGKAAGNGVAGYVPLTLTDRMVGMHLAVAILAALTCRERTGIAQEVEVPMFETFASVVAGDHLAGESFVPPRGPAYYSRLLASGRRPFRTRDGWIAVLPYSDVHWQRFFALLGQEAEFLADPRLSDPARRSADLDHAYARVGEALLERDTAEWLALLSEANIPAAPINDIDALLHDPHLEAVGFWREVELDDGTRLRTPAPVGNWSATPPDPPRAPPSLRRSRK